MRQRTGCGARGLLQEPLWTARQQLCQALAALRRAVTGWRCCRCSIMNRRRVRLHWLASLLVDAQKRQRDYHGE
ncbi:hypothetical protein MJ575_11430 [Klebsiella pneumoniae]|nr:hypothetical protein MJ575_11430 [Klebsiella pneumoniae]